MNAMFRWFKKQAPSPIPAEHREKAWEYQQVAGLLCLDIDITVACCESCGTTGEMLFHIRELQAKKDSMISDKADRESRWAAANTLFTAVRAGRKGEKE